MAFRREKQYVMVKTRCFDVNNDNYYIPIRPNSERYLVLNDLPNEI